MSPVLTALKELGGSARPAEVCNMVTQDLDISDEERSELLDGGQSRVDNMIRWARFYLAKASDVKLCDRS